MAKMDFKKAEDAVSNTMQDFTKKQLLAQTPGKQEKDAALKEKIRLIKKIDIRLKSLSQKDPAAYKSLKVKKKDITALIEGSEELTEERWKSILELKEKLETLLKEREDKQLSDIAVVEKERHKHINKRHNVNPKWLPLH
jgi:hypothetical protein